MQELTNKELKKEMFKTDFAIDNLMRHICTFLNHKDHSNNADFEIFKEELISIFGDYGYDKIELTACINKCCQEWKVKEER